MKRLLAFLALAAFGAPSFASGWTSDLTVTSVFVEATSDLVVIYTSGGSAYTSGCTTNLWIFTGTTDARRGRALSVALSALTTGKQIRMWYTDSCANWSYHEATALMIVQ